MFTGAAIFRTLDTVIDECEKEAPDDVAWSPDPFRSRDDAQPCYYHRLEYDFYFSLFSLLSTVVFCRVFQFV